MPSATVRWGAWTNDEDLALDFGPGWSVDVCTPADGPDIGPSGIADAYAAPIGTPPIRELARGRRAPCIVIDDLTRPTSGRRLLPPLLDELEAVGIPWEDVTVLLGIANHRQMVRDDLLKKLGPDVLGLCRIAQHFSWDDCVPFGETTRGTPVEINRRFAASDLRILVGSIIPHAGTGFSGGAKLLMPGIASASAGLAFHTGPAARGQYAVVETEARLDAEEAARLVGVDLIVNSVPTSRMGVAGLVVGDLVAAHRVGVEIARRVFATPTPSGVDVCVLSVYPKDGEFIQHLTAFSPYKTAAEPIVRDGGTVVVVLPAGEGYGFHSLFGPGMQLWRGAPTRLRDRDLIFFCPNLRPGDLPDEVRDGTTLFRTWNEARQWLERKHGPSGRAAVFPCATIQLAAT